jgi:chitinase
MILQQRPGLGLRLFVLGATLLAACDSDDRPADGGRDGAVTLDGGAAGTSDLSASDLSTPGDLADTAANAMPDAGTNPVIDTGSGPVDATVDQMTADTVALPMADVGGAPGKPVEATFKVLPYRVIDAEYSAALDAIIMVTDAPDRSLHVYDPLTGTDRAVALPLAPAAVSVAPDGKSAAVAHDANVSTYDLVTAQAIKTCPVTSDAIDVVLAGNGWAYVFPRTDQWSAIHGVQMATCMEAKSSSNAIYAGTVAKLHPAGNRMYGADRGLSPSDIERYNFGPTGAPVAAYDSPYHGDYPMCGNLWMSEEGQRIFTACGRVFRASEVQTEDMTYNGRLEGSDGIRHLTHSTKLGKVFVVPTVNPYAYPTPNLDADVKLRVHNYEFLTFDREIPLPMFPGKDATTNFKARGRFVFVRSDGSGIHVVVQADMASGVLNDYAIATIKP